MQCGGTTQRCWPRCSSNSWSVRVAERAHETATRVDDRCRACGQAGDSNGGSCVWRGWQQLLDCWGLATAGVVACCWAFLRAQRTWSTLCYFDHRVRLCDAHAPNAKPLRITTNVQLPIQIAKQCAKSAWLRRFCRCTRKRSQQPVSR